MSGLSLALLLLSILLYEVREVKLCLIFLGFEAAVVR